MRCVLLFLAFVAFQGANGHAFDLLAINHLLSERAVVPVTRQCGELTDMFLTMRDDYLQFVEWVAGNDYDDFVSWTNSKLPVTIDDDQALTRLACEIEEMKTTTDAEKLMKKYDFETEMDVKELGTEIKRKIPFINSIATEYKKMVVLGVAWIRKTNFPDTFPIPKTHVAEVEALLTMEKNVWNKLRPFFEDYDIPFTHWTTTDTRELAIAFLESSSLEECFALFDTELNEDMMGYVQTWYRVARSNPEYEAMELRFVDTLLAVLDHLNQRGKFDLQQK